MSTLLEALNHSVTQRIGWVLLHTLWQGALIGLAFSIARFALRRCSANARYAVGCVALMLFLAAPVITLLVTTPAIQTGTDSLQNVPGSNSEPRNLRTNGDGGFGDVGAEIRRWADFLGQAAPSLAVCWMAGVVVFSARLGRSCWWQRKLRTGDQEAAEPGWIEWMDDLRCRLEISRPVRLVKSRLAEVPAVIGWLRPVILLPAASVAGLSPEQLGAILAHELAHIRRHDYLVNVFQCIVETLLFYHPAVWWISRCVREEREHCCDDLVVKVCGDRLTYARALATLEESRALLPQLVCAATGGSLLNRIRRVVGGTTDAGPVTAGTWGGLALLAIGLGLIAPGVYLVLAAPTYEAVSRIRIEGNDPTRPTSESERGSGRANDTTFLRSEFEVIRSELVLGQVIDRLGLKEAWGKKGQSLKPLEQAEALEILKGKLKIKPIVGTTLVEIRVASELPVEAAKIANAIAEGYREFRERQRMELSKANIHGLEDRYAEQARKIQTTFAEWDDLRKELDISNPYSLEDRQMKMPETVRKLKSLRIEKESAYRTMQSLVDGLAQLSREKLIQVLPTAAGPDQALTLLIEKLTVAQQRLIEVRKDFGPNHPDTIKAGAVVEDLNNKVNDRAEGILLGLRSRTASLQEGLAALNKEVDQAEEKEVEMARQNQEQAGRLRPYFEAKRKLEEQERFGQVLSMKIASEKIEQALPKNTLVQIVDSAALPFRPSAERPRRGLALVVFGLILEGVGVAMLRSGRDPVGPPSSAKSQPISA
jgi:uncharacterized protein involved in exopolysaccharide biosynthesis/beta-lactamase regulating signal transducer with metallopeptidase domain